MGDQETIYALSSGAGRAGVAVIRVSGPAAARALIAIAGHTPEPRVATVTWLRRPVGGERIDQGLILWFPGGDSFTGEPVAEFQTHGGRAVVKAMFDALSQVDGLRLARPGEFTRRAVENGKLDLTRAEAVADLIDADTDLQRRQALAGLEGRLARTVGGWRETLLSARALIAADIDFADQEDAADIAHAEVHALLSELRGEMASVLQMAERGRLVVDGFKTAIIGRPNVGKSSLLNALAGSDVAIVTDVPGTTRDLLEVRLDLQGMPVRLVDTAGIRDSVDPVERIGVERARLAAEGSDLVLLLDDGQAGAPEVPANAIQRTVRVRTKADLGCLAKGTSGGSSKPFDLAISSVDGTGLSALLAIVAKHAAEKLDLVAEPSIVAQHRQVAAIEAALRETEAALKAIDAGAIELVDEHVRRIGHELERLVGLVGVEEMLGAIFSRFCIGK